MKVHIADDLLHGRQDVELERAVREGLILRDYLNAEISLGQFAQLMGMGYVEGRDWLHQHGIATLRRFTDPELEKIEAENYRKVAAELGISVPEPDA